MHFLTTDLLDVYIIEPEKIVDRRGFFARTWCKREFEARGLAGQFVQANAAFNSEQGTLRGMHFQARPYEEIKLVRCTKGAIYDVVVDLRPESPTYCRWIGVELSDQNHRALYVPKGFAHGYQTLTDHSEVFYQVSEFYTPASERGVRWNDSAFEIEWPEATNRIVSDKDQSWPDYRRD